MPWVDLSDSDPGQVDFMIRAAIHKCWYALPAEQREIERVESVFRRLVDRAWRNLREDQTLFPPPVEEPSDPWTED